MMTGRAVMIAYLLLQNVNLWKKSLSERTSRAKSLGDSKGKILWCLIMCAWLAQSCLTLQPQAPLAMGFPGQVYWGGLPFSPPRDLSYPEIQLGCPALQADSLLSQPPGKSIIIIGDGKMEPLLLPHLGSWTHVPILVWTQCFIKFSKLIDILQLE